MFGVSVGASRRLRWGSLSLATIILFLTVTVDEADARRRKRGYYRHVQTAKVYRPTPALTRDSRYAAIVVDGNSGSTLHEANPDSLRHPASLTKVMTLYLLFERLEAGKLKLNTPLDVSEHAASQSPTKLGLRAGQTIEVEDAIKGLVTRSANDAAAVIAEAIAGDEDEFAKLMTRKARALGMSRTVYKNASGLPDEEQVTTARDQALLGLGIQERFPKYYRYFATSSFTYRGSAIRNHNRLLGRVEGVDGIKTGYTRASGFNLLTSMRRGGRHVVGVVLGGASGGARDARMRSLIEGHIQLASLKRTGTAIAAATEPAEPRAATRFVTASAPSTKAEPEPRGATRYAVASAPATKVEAEPRSAARYAVAAAPVPKAEAAAAPEAARPSQRYAVASAPTRPADPAPTAAIPTAEPGSTDPIRPTLVKTLTVRPGAFKTASLAPSFPTYQAPAPQPPPAPAAKAEPLPPPPGARPGILGVLPAKAADVAAAAAPRAVEAPPRAAARGGWMIQIGAFPEEDKAKQHLSSAQKASRLLGAADAYTERVVKGDKTLYRARFAGFDKDKAEAACKQLKRSEITCMPMRN